MLKTDPVLSAPTIGSGRWVEVDAYPPRKIILPQIDGLRGVAICAVIFQHAFSHGISHALVAFGVIGFPYLVDNGWMGVSLFFILSGFVLSLPYTGAETKFYDLAEVFAFYRRRARRLLPLLRRRSQRDGIKTEHRVLSGPLGRSIAQASDADA
jgi:Acyltransferase family